MSAIFLAGAAAAQPKSFDIRAGDPATDAQGSSVGEVVVTAQRREERLTDVPIAITAKTGAQLKSAGINTAMDLSLVTPGLYYAVQGAFAQPTIRGIGTSIAGAGFDANVAVYIDGVYQASQTANLLEFGNIADVEVLKGPQGTLFGRNATGGAIQITTADPSFNFGGNASLSYGRFNAIKTTGYFTGGLAPDLAGSLSVLYSRDDGYAVNVTTGNRDSRDNTVALRGKLLWTPTDRLRIVFSANYADAFNNSPFDAKPVIRDGAYVTNLAGLLTPGEIPSNPYRTALNGDPSIDTVSYGGSVNARYSGDQGTLTSITSYEVIRPFLGNVDTDETPIFAFEAQIHIPEETFSQEVNFASKQMGKFSWVGGVYFYYDHTGFDLKVQARSFSNVTADITADAKDNAEAVFAEGNYNITDQLELIVGGRFSSEGKHAVNGLVGVPGNFLDGAARWNSFTPRVVLVYKIDPNSNVYFNYSQGFKSGGFNTVALNQPTPVSPEKVDAFEVGFKHSRGGIRFNASTFYYDYKNIQVEIQTNNGVSGGVSTFLQNAAKATIYGADFDFTDQFNENWRVDLGAAYTHGVYNHYVGAILTTYDPINGPGQTASAVPLNGLPMIRSPHFQANITPTFDYPLPFGRFEANATVSYNSGFIWALGPLNDSSLWRQPAYTLVNATASWISPDDKYRLSVWGTNLTNAKYDIYSNPTATGAGHALGAPWSAGVRADVKF